MKRSSSHSQSGFTLIEVMVVTAILAVLMLAFGTYLFQQAKLSRAQDSKMNLNQLRDATLQQSGQADTLIRAEALQIQSP